MGIRFAANGPTDTEAKLERWIPEIRHASLMADASGGAVTNLSEPYQVKYVALEDLAGGKFDAARTRWRHMLAAGQQPQGEIELDEHLDPVALFEGESKDGFMSAMRVADALDGDFEASVIMCPPIRFVALYLHGEGGDLLIPFAPNRTPLDNYEPVSVDEALKVLRGLAAEIVSESAESDETGG